MDFFSLSNPHLYIALALSVINGGLLCFTGYKFMQIVQLSAYKIKGYFMWLKKTPGRYFSRIFMLAFLSIACMLVFISVFDGIDKSLYTSYASILFYFAFSAVFINYMYKAPKKTPLKQTHRMNRFICVLALLNGGATFGLIALCTIYFPHVRFIIIGATPILLTILVPLTHYITLPFENLNRLKYINKAKSKLGKTPNLIKIGITGSYGKTSTKYILNTILSEKYKVCMSPNSFNTPLGITKVIIDYLKPEHEVLIAEMGAKHPLDIGYLCTIINPQYGILTSVGKQHLETFKSIENVKKTKNELIKSLPIYGYAVFNGDNEICSELCKACTIEHSYTSKTDENAKAYASDITIDENGMAFTLHIDKKTAKCTTKLLGEHNLENILLCCAMATRLNLTIKQIATAISKLKPVPHRLELINSGTIKILDNSYNSSPDGAVASLKVLELFKANKKVVITPGLIELGAIEDQENEKFGENIAKAASICIIVNETHKEPIIKGLKKGGFNDEQIFFAPTLDSAKKLMSEQIGAGDVVLFENDLPDNYT